MSEKLYSIYHNGKVDYLTPFLKSPEMERIDHIGMHCGLEYTQFPFYKDFKKYSRYEHSLGVALIIHHFSQDKRMTLSGLFHDIATPSFAHVIDFLKGDHLKQEATEERTSQILENSTVIQKELGKINLTTKDVDDYHKYPIADNDTPKLSADRLEYTLHNLFNYSFASLEEIKEMYDDLALSKNETGETEISFQHEKFARKFALLTLKNSHVYVTNEDRYAMEYLSRVIKKAILDHHLTEEDLYTTEENVIFLLSRHESDFENFQHFRNLKVIHTEKKPIHKDSYQIQAKKRFIDPLVIGKGRISALDQEVRHAIDSFLREDFSDYIYSE
jgi:uncharacterized protein